MQVGADESEKASMLVSVPCPPMLVTVPTPPVMISPVMENCMK